MELMRKITPAFLAAGWNLKNIESEIYLGRIYGMATSLEIVTTQYGEAEKFIGEFVGTRADGETGMAAVCYLPSTVSHMLADALKDGTGVKFGFDISAMPSEKSATGYEWKIKPLMEVKPTESLLSFATSFPALPGAKAERDPDPKPEVEHKGKARPK